jgi:VCBS repeat-containing protein
VPLEIGSVTPPPVCATNAPANECVSGLVLEDQEMCSTEFICGPPLEDVFDEADLPLGSSPTPSALQRPGSITIQADAQLKSLTVEGQELLDSEGSLITQTVVNDEVGVIEVAFSTLELSEITNTYTLSYTISLTGNFDHSSADNPVDVPFTITATDINDTTTSTTRTGALLNDVPTAVFDTNVTVSGGVLNVAAVDGVLSNDTLGADGATVTGVDTTDTQGSLTLNGDGSYSYTAFANATYQDIFTYTLTDGDGDSSTATLTIDVTDGAQ